MGITIDKAIDIMERYEMYGFFSQRDGRNKAVDTMRRYQEIEQIVTNILNNTAKEDERYVYDYLGDIIEVIEDGKID